FWTFSISRTTKVIFGNVAARTSSLRADSQTNKASNRDRYRKACRNREKNKLDKGGCSLTIVTHQDVFNKLEEWAPKQLAYDWNPIGLQVCNAADYISIILINLDVTDALVDEAISNSCNFILGHHPLIFKALTSINTSPQQGSTVKKLI